MRLTFLFLLLLLPASAQEVPESFDQAAAERFAKLALACVHKEYPNKIAHVLNSDADVAPPRTLTPAFYGCYDWHSTVHGHWLLARLAREYGAVGSRLSAVGESKVKTTTAEPEFVAAARAVLRRSITRENIAAEVKYLNATGRTSFERPYGLAWLLQLAAELREWGEAKSTTEAQRHREKRAGGEAKATAEAKAGDAEAAELAEILRPLEEATVARLKTWLPKLSHPLRTGEHSQTAFALGLMLDYARTVDDPGFERLLVAKARTFYLKDKNCPLSYEPGGEDFVSPCLAEADVMRRVLLAPEYKTWLRGFLPVLFEVGAKATQGGEWLKPAVVTDPTDGKLAHLDGLNLSRAWMLEGMVTGLIQRPARSGMALNAIPIGRLEAAARAHREAGLASVTGKHYEGGHWLGSFAVYLVTKRGF